MQSGTRHGVSDVDGAPSVLVSAGPGWHRSLQLVLATFWLFDGILQLQPFFFTAGPRGFSGMLGATGSGNAHWVASTIAWSASVVGHHPVLTDSAFAAVQMLIGLGIAWRPTRTPALGLSIVWSVGVWWFGEGLGGVTHGAGSPSTGGPGAVLLYAVVAVVLWPTAGREGWRFAAAARIGEAAAKMLWAAVWVVLAGLSVFGAARSPSSFHDAVVGLGSGQPGWLGAVDRRVASAVNHDGVGLALLLATLCLVIAASVFAAGPARLGGVALAVVLAVVMWIFTQNFGMILAGAATDPNSGPVLVLLALTYWPVAARRTGPHVMAEPRAAVAVA